MPRFEPGKSGNANGRPRGRTDKRTALRRLLEPHAEALVSKAVEMALKGDASALRLCLDRLIPAYRAVSPALSCGVENGSLTERAEAALSLVSSGAITAEDANHLLGAIASLAKIRESDEIARRLDTLEQRNA